jgi:flagellar motility protein MotE (MotC chaperone)
MGKPARRKARGGALLLISSLMILSAVIRLGLEAAPAIAREAARLGEFGGGGDARPDDTPSRTPEEYRAMLSAFAKRDAALNARESEVDDRMRALAIANKAIDRRLASLREAEEKLRATLALADGASERDLTGLTSVYEKMKPKETAALFEEMDPAFAAGFLARMRPEIAAGVMAGLSPKAAYTISVILAGRNMGVPTD